jgi:hypothetical protein
MALHSARPDAHERGGVLDGSASGDVGGENINLAGGPRPRWCAAQVPLPHARSLATAASHSSTALLVQGLV